ncbi:hypothetical protein BASA81_001184 [Batrachochytrium salamandrivorans]|nr:hypothetical protein BASA81_001184 [Batrachochytrium salamandrivorans]
MLVLLLLPLPPNVAKSVIHLCDALLFSLPHPNIPLSLFWTVFMLSAATFLIHLDDSWQSKLEFQGGSPNHLHARYVDEDRDRLLVKALACERNAWISGFNLAAWIVLHRYRSLLKRYYRLKDTVATTAATTAATKKE